MANGERGTHNSDKTIPCDWVSLAAVLIALAALFVAVWQGKETRRFYKLSTLPYLSFIEDTSSEMEVAGLAVLSERAGSAGSPEGRTRR